MRKFIYILFILLYSVSYAQNNKFTENKYNLANAYIKANQLDKAIEILEGLNTTQKWNYKYFSALNNVYLKKKDYAASIKLITERLNRTPNDINLYSLLGKTHYTSGNYKQAFETWNDALSRLPDNPVNYRIIANAAIEMRAFDYAIEVIKRAQSKYPSTGLFIYDLANLYTVTMKYDKAVEEYCNILLKQPNQLPMVKNRLSQIITNHGATQTTIDVLNKFYEKTGEISFLQLLSFVYIQNDDFEHAFEINKKLDEDSGTGNYLYSFAQTAYAENKIAPAQKAYQFLLDNFDSSPLLPKIKLGYAKTTERKLILQSADSSSAWKPVKPKLNYDKTAFGNLVDSYKDLLNYFKDPNRRAEIYFRIGKIYKDYIENRDSASFYFIKCFKDFPLSEYAFECKYELAEIFIQNNEEEKAAKELKGILKSPRTKKKLKSKSQFLFSKLNYWKGNYDNALKGLAEISKDLSDDNANDAIQLSLLITTLRSDSLTLLSFAKADKEIFVKNYQGALSTLSALAMNENLMIWNSFAQFKSAEIYIALHNLRKAEEILIKLANDEKPSLVKDKSLFLLGEIYNFGLKDIPKAIEQYQKLLEKFPNSLFLDKAREYLNSLQS